MRSSKTRFADVAIQALARLDKSLNLLALRRCEVGW